MKRVRNIWRGLLLTVLAVSALCMGAGAIDVDDCEALYQEITVEAGQLMPETGETVESDIYGYIVGYELKKGHVLSISNTDYVFSVRQLVDGDYSTLLKSATSASFTAVEDMTVGCLVRKPDRSAVTGEELAGIALVDTLYGMEGVEGYACRFTVEAETIDGETTTTRAAIFLPESYSEDGDPTPLIVMTNGYSAYLTESVWNGNTAENRGVIQNYLDAGYGVYVVDNTAAWTAQTPDLGCPQLVDSYWEAYDYIQEHFNVTEKLIIHARSFGTFAAVRMMREQPEEITCAVMTGPRVSMKLAWNAVDKAFVAGRFGFADASGATYEENILAGHDPYTDVDGAEYVLPPTFWMMAEGDATAQPLEMIEKLKAHGNEVETATYSGVSHTGVCTLNAEEMAADALAYIAAQREEEGLAGKKLSILGASISTFAGVSNGAAAETTNSTIAGNAKYYPSTTVTDVALEDTWWMQAVNDLGLELLVNNSWSGSSLLHERSGTVGAYVERCVQLHDDTGDNAGTDPDLIAIQLGTNDFQYYKDTLGTADIDYDALITANGDGTYTYAEPQTSLEAAAIVLHKIGVRYPKAEVYYLNLSQRVDGTDVLLAQFNEELAKVTAHFGAYLVDIYGSAITQADFDTYIGDGRVHPNKLGMDVYAEAFKTAVLENTAYSAQAHTVRLNLTGVSADYGTDKLVLDGEGFAVALSAAAGDAMEATVTMGGKDITASCYAEGVVTINAVTADVVITAAAAHIPQNYIWTYDGSGLAGENALTMLAGTVTDGQFDKVCYSLETPVVLSHEKPWVVEWKSEGTWRNSASSTGGRLFSTTDVNAQYNARYIFKSANSYLVAMGEKTTTGSHNYGIALSDYGIDGSAEHTYRLENRVSDDGSNMVWLYVDGTEIGPMNHYYIGTTDQKTASDWLSSKDFVLPYIGTDTHGLTNCSVEYIKVYEDGHEHVYETAVTAPTCTEKGYTTYTCACGESYADDYVDAIGHSWEDGVCTTCGESKRPYQRLTYFTVEVQTEDGQSYSDNAVLYLPKTYSPDGEPVKLIIYCKQGNSQITDSSNPIETVGFYNYLISLGYAVLGVDGVPDAWREKLGLDDTRVVGNPLAVQGTEKAYDYVVEHYNIDADGCFISGKSQGGHYAQNVIDLTDIPILAAAEQSPVCSMQYHQWDLNASKTIGGVSFTKAARLNVARIYGFPEVTSNTELLALEYDADLVAEYDPWVRNSENVYTGFSQKSNLWYLPGGTSAEDIAMTKISRCPVKIWCAEDDTAISADVMKVFVQAIQNGGGTAEISVASSGGHGFFTKQSAVGTFIENGKQYSTLPIAVEIAEWFARYGGYECKHEYAVAVTVPTCTEQGYTTYTCSVCGEKYVADYVDALGHSYENGVCTACGDAIMIVSLRYDDHMDVSGKTVEIIDAGTPTSYQVGYGIAEKSVLDTAVVTLEGETLVATGVGSAKVRIDGQIYQVEVSAAPISLLLLAGQSNMQGSEGDANQSIICPEGQVYATYGDCYTMTVDNATNFAASALTGAGSAVNVNGTTENLSGYPIYSLNAAGAGKAGPDSGFAYEWVQQTGEKVWVVNAAHGGSAISTWQKSGANYKEAVALFSACQETLRQEIAAGHYTLSHMGCFWCQGCADEPQTAEWYVNKYLAMHESLKADLVADMDSDPATADVTLEFAGIIPIRSGHQNSVSYRGGVYTDTTSVPYYESFLDLRMNGPRVAQYWMGNNPELTDIFNVCTIQENWATLPDGSDGVAAYFAEHYPNGRVDYTTQVAQKESWYSPTTPAAVHDSIHYNQIGYNEVGREAARNLLYAMGIVEAPEAEAEVKFVSWDGFTEVTEVTASTVGNSATLVVPQVYPVYRSKDVTYTLSDGLSYNYYDLTADSDTATGTLTAKGAEGRVSVAAKDLTSYRWECDGTALATVTEEGYTENALTKMAGTITDGVFTDVYYALAEQVVLRHDRNWVVEWKMTGDWSGMLLSASATSTTEGNTYIFKTLTSSTLLALGERSGSQHLNYGALLGTNTDFTQPHVYRLENRIAADGSNMVYLLLDGVEIGAMEHYYIGGSSNQNKTVDWVNGRDLVFGYIGASGHAVTGGSLSYLEVIEDAAESGIHIHNWSDWETVSVPTAEELGTEKRTCAACGDVQERTVEGVWQKYALGDHLAELPENVCYGTNLWTALEHETVYFSNGTAWATHSSGKVASVTIPVSGGERIWATSFGKGGTHGSSTNGIRVTFFDAYGVAKTLSPAETYAEFSANGYLTAPEGAIAVNIPMWTDSDAWEIYLLNKDHVYSSGVCKGCGAEKPGADSTWDTDGDGVLEILAIGNSFSVDALQYAWQVARSMGISEVVIGNLYIGGCTLETHAANAAGDLGKYTYYYNDNGTWVTAKNYKISTALSDRNWDYVSLQQWSGNSGVESTYNEDLTELIAYVKERSSAKLVWHMTWAYQQDSTHASFPTYGSDQMTMYNAIVAAVQSKIVTNGDIDLIVPNGTAVQNVRTSLIGDTLTRDGHHMSYTYGRYVTGLMFVKAITGLDIPDSVYAPEGVTELNREIAIEAVEHAAELPYEVTQSGYTGEDPGEGYLRLRPTLTQGAYWHPLKEGAYNILITDGANSAKYFATPRFTRDDLPVGSVIIVEDGWQYRPDGWIGDTLQTGEREAATTQSYVVVTEDWWEDYTLRGFNISRTDQSTLEDMTAEDIHEVFRIYVPEESHTHTYSGGVCSICGAAHPAAANYSGKVISILGDSISTFAGYIPTADGFNLEHYARYPQDNLLTDVNETWWMQVISELDAKLGINDSWRGATLSGGAPVTSGTTGENAAMSNLTRIQNLGSNGTPDVILLYGGTNDLAHVSKVGTFVPDTAPSAADLTTKKWDNLADGFVHTLLRLQHYYPDAEIVAMLPTYTISYYSNEKLAQANAVMAAICEHYGVTYVDLRDCGITTADLPDGIHPDATGMDYITDAVLESLLTECEVAAGENEVYSVTHNLTDVKASLGYYKGVSANKAFTETLTADSDMTVTVTMGGEDVTNTCYTDGVVSIPVVTGDLVISAKAAFSLGNHLQAVPEDTCAGTNLWAVLTAEDVYYTLSGWGTNATGLVHSITIPVSGGERIWATSFGKGGTHGSSTNGIRVTFFDAYGVAKTLSPAETYAEFSANGYLTAPEGTVAVNIPMWTDSEEWELYLLDRAHDYEAAVTAPTCTEQGYTTHTCTICGDSYVDSYVDALGHSYSGTAACTVCGDEHPNAANYEDKVISILGASICTFDGYIPVADGFNLQHYARYPQDNLLTDVNDTWWMQVINSLNAKLGINDSWRSTEVYNACTEEVNSSYDGTKACLSSVTRIQNLGSNGTPDVILFFGGTNDITQRRPLGTFDPAAAPTEVDLTSETWTTVADAYTALIMRLQHYYPDSQIVAMLPYRTASNSDAVTAEYTSVFAAICAHYGVTCIDMKDCGITTADLPDGTHPNAKGMDYISNAVLETLLGDCDMEPGENVVHSVTHELSGAESSLSFYKGVSYGKSFITTITGENITVTVTMGGVDITDQVYADGKITISAVTDDVVITAKGVYNADGRLQQLPDDYCCNTNLWTLLDPVNEYYTASGWGNNSNSNYSVTFPVTAGDRIWATSFGAAGTNGYSDNAVRITWFGENGVLKSLGRDVVYAEFAAYGYITVPEGAVALNVPMASNADTWELYILNAEHDYESMVTSPTCTERGYTTYTCAICSDNYVADYTDALGHDWGEGVKDGRENVYTCLRCGETRREARPGSSVSGSVKSYKPAVETKIVLNEDGEAVYESTVSGTEAGFTVEDVASGTYDAVISKAGYLTYTIKNVSVEDEVNLGTIELVAGDFSGDDRINLTDLAAFRADFGKRENLENGTCDIDGDGRVNLTDLAVFRQNFGKTAARDCTINMG